MIENIIKGKKGTEEKDLRQRRVLNLPHPNLPHLPQGNLALNPPNQTRALI
jgi:hypothetical protein